HHEDPGTRLFDDGGQWAFPADVVPAEGEAPALQPARPEHGGVRTALEHLGRIHIGPVGSVDRHTGSLVVFRPAPVRGVVIGAVGSASRAFTGAPGRARTVAENR